MEMKKTVTEIVYTSGMTFEKAESYFFRMDDQGPKYRFEFGREHFSPVQAFNERDYKIKQISNGKIIEDERARNNLIQRLTTKIR